MRVSKSSSSKISNRLDEPALFELHRAERSGIVRAFGSYAVAPVETDGVLLTAFLYESLDKLFGVDFEYAIDFI